MIHYFLIVIYEIFIHPLQWLLNEVFLRLFEVTNSLVLAILLLSIFVNLALIPVYIFSDVLVKREARDYSRVAAKLAEIKLAFSGQERYLITQRLYKIYNYKPIMQIRSNVGLLIQIPVLIAAYQVLENNDDFQGLSSFIFKDMSQPDSLLEVGSVKFNVLPLIMTIFNCMAIYFYTKQNEIGFHLKQYVIPLVFAVALYNMSAALLIYWTSNNIISVFRILIFKYLRVGHNVKLLHSKWLLQLKDVTKQTFVICIAMIIFFIVTPVYMISLNPEDLTFLDVEVFIRTALFFTMIFTLILALANILLHLVRIKKINNFFIYLGLSYVVFAGLVFPVSKSTIMVEPEINPVDHLNLFYCVFGSTIFASLVSLGFRSQVKICLSVIVMIAIFTSTYSIYQHHDNIENTKVSDRFSTKIGPKELFEFSEKRNILVVSFDGLAANIVENLVINDESFKTDFKDFTVFNNSLTHAPTTLISLIADVYGVQDYKAIGYDTATLKRNLYLSDLQASTPASQVPDTLQYNYDLPGITSYTESTSSSKTFDFFRYVFARIISSYTQIIWKKGRFEQFEGYVGINKVHALSSLHSEIGEAGLFEWVEGVNDYYNYDRFLASATAVEKDITVRYLHFYFTHVPIVFDEKCNFKGTDVSWFSGHQNQKGVEKLMFCGLQKFSAFITKMKDLAVYDNSLIIFKSDHGKTANYFNKYPDNQYINGTKFGYNRYKSFFMIKDVNTDQSSSILRKELVTTGDIAKTICMKISTQNDCQKFNGVDVLASEIDIEKPFNIYVPKNSDDRHWYFENLISVKIPDRTKGLLEYMLNSESITLSVE